MKAAEKYFFIRELYEKVCVYIYIYTIYTYIYIYWPLFIGVLHNDTYT